MRAFRNPDGKADDGDVIRFENVGMRYGTGPEILRDLTFTVETGPVVGARRALAPPPSTLVIGRGDEATWVVLDEDLSRTHAEVRRGWDGVAIRDLDSKNGTTVDGTPVTAWTPLHHGARLALGKVVLRFDDPAEAHLRGGPVPPKPAVRERGPVPRTRAGHWPMIVAAAIAVVAAAGAVWMLVG